MGDTDEHTETEAEDSTGSEDTTTTSLDDIDQDEVEKEREQRLDPDNRPEGAEVDNTQRDFDAERGTFTDSEHYDEQEPTFVSEEEAGSGGEED